MYYSLCYYHSHYRIDVWIDPPPPDIHIKEEPDSEDWQLGADSTLNTSDLSHLHVRLVDDDDPLGQEGKRLRRVACTCPNCKESGGR